MTSSNSRRRRRWTWALAVGLFLLPVPPSSASLGPSSFEGRFGGAAVSAEGVLRIDGGPLLVGVQPSSEETSGHLRVLSSARARVVLWEQREPEAGLAPRPAGELARSIVGHERETMNASVERLEVQALRIDEGSRWVVASQEGGSVTASTTDPCALRIHEGSPRPLGPSTGHGADAGFASSSDPWIETACAGVESASVTGPTQVSLFGSVFRLAFDSQVLEVQVGEFEERNRTSGLVERVQRTLLIDVLEGPSTFDVPARSALEAHSRSLAVDGHLRIVGARGWLTWSVHRFEGFLPPLDPVGTVTLVPDGREWSVRGEARPLVHPHHGLVPDPSRLLPPTLMVAALGAFGAAALGYRRVLRWILGGPLLAIAGRRAATCSDRRRTVADFLLSNPGLSVRELSNALGIAYETARHDVRALLRAHVLRADRSGRDLALFHATGPGVDAAKARLFRRPLVVRLLERLEANPGERQGGLAKSLGVSQQYTSRLLNRLVDVGLVRVERFGRRARYRANAKAAPASDPPEPAGA